MSTNERILPNLRFKELSVPRGININWVEKIEGVPESGFNELNISLKASNWYDHPIRSGFDLNRFNMFFESLFSFFIRFSFILWIICFCCFLYAFSSGTFQELLSHISNLFSFEFINQGFSFLVFLSYLLVVYFIAFIIALVSKIIVFIDNTLYNLNSEIKLKLTSDSLEIETFGFMNMKETFKAENIKNFYYNKYFDLRMIVSSDGEGEDRDYKLLSDLPSEYIARFFEQEFERTLNIDDTPIEGEYDFNKKNLYTKFEEEEDNKSNDSSDGKQQDDSVKHLIDDNYKHPFKSIVNFSKYFSFSDKEDVITITKYSSSDEAVKNLLMLFLSIHFSFFMFATSIYYLLFAMHNIYFDYISTIFVILYICILIIYFIVGFFYYKYRFLNYAVSMDKNELIFWDIDFFGKKKLSYSNDIGNIVDFRAYECDLEVFRILQNPENILPNIIKSIRGKKYGFGILVYMKDGTSNILIKNIGSSQNAEYLADMLYDMFCKD